MSWFCGLCGPQRDAEDAEAAERQPLLAQYDDETARQRRLHAKLHSYQMARALGQGYLPSTGQVVANLRTLISALEQPQQPQLSRPGRALLRETTRWLQQLIALAQHKNGDDQLQDFAWWLARSCGSVDVDGLVGAAGRAGAASSTQATAAFQSLKTVGSLLLTNTDFRLFLADLTDVGRDVFRDTAVALSDASRVAAEHVDTQKDEQKKKEEDKRQSDKQGQSDHSDNAADPLPQAQTNLADMAGEVAAGATSVAAEAAQSATDKLVDNDDGVRDRLLARLRQAVARLRRVPDYSASISLLTALLQRAAAAYVRAAATTVERVVDEVEQQQEEADDGDEMDAALHHFWSFVTSFGDEAAWNELAERFHRLLDRVRGDNNRQGGEDSDRINAFVRQVSEALQALMTDPAFFDHIDERMEALQRQVSSFEAPLPGGTGAATTSQPTTTSLRQDIEALLEQAQRALATAGRDKEVTDLVRTTGRLADVLWPDSEEDASGSNTAQLLADAANVFVPLLVDAVQHVPIPRLEIAAPDVDLLLENVVLEPGDAVNGSSFLPYRLHVQVRNDVDVYKGSSSSSRALPSAGLRTAATFRVEGLSVAAEDVGYVLRLHAGPLLRLTDVGIASVRVDGRGVDVQVDAAVVRDAADTVLALRDVRVRVHRLDYTLRESRHAAWLAWLLRPLLRPLLRRTLEQQLAGALTARLQALNRELVFARERLRAARIATSGSGGSSLGDLGAFVRAVTARFSPPADPDADTRVSVGLRPDDQGVFQGVYAPGSLLRVWDEEARQAQDRIETYARDGWRNSIFDVPTAGNS